MTSPSTQSEQLRRQRVFRIGACILLLCQIVFAASYLLSFVPPVVSTTGVLLIFFAGAGWFLWANRWCRAAGRPVGLTPEQEASVARAKHTWVRRQGVLGFGLFWGTAMALGNSWSAITSEPPASAVWQILFELAFWIPAGLLTGYVWGRVMWYLRPLWAAAAVDAERPS